MVVTRTFRVIAARKLLLRIRISARECCIPGNFFDLELVKVKKFIRLLILLISLSLTACSSGMFSADTLPWISGETILFKDDFSSQTGGWQVHEDQLSFSGYYQNGFRMWAEIPNFQFWSSPGLNFQDAIIYVSARKMGGPADNLFGILCRYQDEANFYALVIGSDGYYGIYKMQDGEQTLVNQSHLDFSDVINRGDEVNEIRAVCQAEQIALIVNEVMLINVQDDTFQYGDVGLIVGNFSQKGVDILFDNFIVVSP